MTSQPTNNLTPFESAVLAKLLEGDHPALRALREQVRMATVKMRTFSGAGFFVQFDIPESAPDPPFGKRKLHFGDVTADVPSLKHGAGFVLFVESGRVSKLEGYSYDEPWYGEPEQFELRYLDPSRSAVIRALEEQ